MIHIDYKDSRPLYEQISSKLSVLILHGVFEPDSQLPSVRNLAVELAINPNTIQKAYADLERKGYIYSVKGKGNFVSDTSKIQEEKKMELIEKFKALVKEASELGVGIEDIKQVLEQYYPIANS
ncbi:GntR family transcriptional regulator [[Clostridium] polysaccharolyticum]|uniref:GntR family transcriptional regulator n=1 Tax=[Clostridium] polysaccharolyticum TaxID=29364 RepID=A0A1I0B716_9FIRM|nr:GntR family transcriptional regulator [[Clostridium] polysaccharolyticum]SET02666.1 GntR family transcriptional regulator [[Clostridium] polysaccharolyticum]